MTTGTDTKDTTIDFLRAQVKALQSELERLRQPQPLAYTITPLQKYDACNRPITNVNYGG